MKAGAPVLVFAPELLLQAQDIRLLILDVDGVLTDGRLYYGASGEMLKAFNTLDGHGLKALQGNGVTVAIISGRSSDMVAARARELGIDELHQGVGDKLAVAERLLQRLGLAWQQVAMMGDDWPDAPVFLRAGLRCVPAQAHEELRARAHFVSRHRGGEGAVRELCDLLLMARSRYREAFEEAFGG
jgi:3-deoxy-D-manno-octulosonate 8-phosphate phosphatase (KDO 8-P phosphatase)